MSYPEPLTRLVDQLKRLPGIGAKSAQRLAFHILRTPRDEADRLIDAIRDVKERVTYCSVCSNTTDVDPCMYCSSETRNHRLICVVEEPQNVTAIEKTRDFKGVYHVLMGALSPLQGIGPDPVQRRQDAHQDVIDAAELARLLDDRHVLGLLDHADEALVARGARAEGTRIGVRDVVAR